MEKDIYILGIESSCDETSVAIVKNRKRSSFKCNKLTDKST